MALRVRALPYLERMELAYAVADLAVARAGATSIAELTVCGVPSILVPYPHATEDHQEANARELVRAGAADALPGRRPLAGGARTSRPRARGRRRPPGRDGERAAAWSTPDADERLAALVEEAVAMTVVRSAGGQHPDTPRAFARRRASVHLIGVGGAGMRNLARLFLARGIAVTGSDLKDSKGLVELRGLGADVWVGHDPARIGTPERGRDLERDRPRERGAGRRT